MDRLILNFFIGGAIDTLVRFDRMLKTSENRRGLSDKEIDPIELGKGYVPVWHWREAGRFLSSVDEGTHQVSAEMN